MASPLLQLPPELVEAIAAATDSHEILSIRLTSREMSRHMDKIFLERYFTTRRHLVTRESFQTLINISKDKRLRSKLKTIELVVTNLSSVTELHSRGNDQKAMTGDARSPPQSSSQSIWSSWCHEAEEITRGRKDVSMLSEVLSNLRIGAVFPELKVSTQTHFSPTPYGFRRLVQQLDSDKHTCSRNEHVLLGRSPDVNSETTSLLLSALARTQFPVRSLELSERRSPLNVRSLSSNMSVSCLKSVWSRLEMFSASSGCLHNLSAQDLAAIGDFNRSAFSRLQELRLDFSRKCCQDSFLHPHVLTSLVTTAPTIHLTGAVLRQQDLCAFLAQQKDSLRHLVLRHVVVGPNDKFAELFAWMEAELSLDSLELHWLRQGEDHMDEMSGRGAEYTYRGRQEVRAGLQELARTVSFGDLPQSVGQALEARLAL